MKATERERILQALRCHVDTAKARLSTGSQEFDAIIRESPSGLPHPGGVQRIRDVARELSSARQEYLDAYLRLNKFVREGIIPDDLSTSVRHETCTGEATEKSTGQCESKAFQSRTLVEVQQELAFIREFQDQVIEMIRLVEEWEQRDAQFIVAQPDGALPVDVHRDAYHPSYENLYNQISTKMDRFNGLCSRYGLAFPECLLFVIPTAGRNGVRTHQGLYRFSFPVSAKTPILGTILRVEVAANHHLEQARHHGRRRGRQHSPRYGRSVSGN